MSVTLAKLNLYMLSVPRIDPDELERFLTDQGAPDWKSDSESDAGVMVEVAGRLCYQSYNTPRPGGHAAYVRRILSEGHGSVLEHANFGFIVTGVSRSFTHELVRHRAGFSYSQLSQRFVDESDAAFVVPPALEASVAMAREFMASNKLSATEMLRRVLPIMESGIYAGLVWLADAEASLRSYEHLVEFGMGRLAGIEDKTLRRKKAREAARSVLPNCTETKVYVTGNVRALRHFLERRGDYHADAEIFRFAGRLHGELLGLCPSLFSDIVASPETGALATDFRKV